MALRRVPGSVRQDNRRHTDTGRQRKGCDQPRIPQEETVRAECRTPHRERVRLGQGHDHPGEAAGSKDPARRTGAQGRGRDGKAHAGDLREPPHPTKDVRSSSR